MKQLSLPRLLNLLRIFIIILVTTFISHLLLSFTVTKYADDLWKQLGISQQAGTDNIKTSFLNNYLQHYGARNIKNIAAGNRAAVAKDLLEYSKKYISSPQFKTAYEELRMSLKPQAPERTTPRGKDEIRKEKIAETEASLKKMEAGMKDMTADMQKIMEPTLELFRQQLKDYKDPKNEMIDLYVMSEKFTVEQKIKDYEERTKKWEQDYPADVKFLVKKRLQHYLDLSATVDFNAALVEKYRKMVFVKPAYESKADDWKMIFRAGKEVNDVSRPFAQQWLSELK